MNHTQQKRVKPKAVFHTIVFILPRCHIVTAGAQMLVSSTDYSDRDNSYMLMTVALLFKGKISRA